MSLSYYHYGQPLNVTHLENTVSATLRIAGFLAFVLFTLAQLTAGLVGIEDSLGLFWALGALAMALMFRFTLPLTVGSFFGAMNVWGWHWVFAALFAAPGLLFIIPGVLASTFVLVKR